MIKGTKESGTNLLGFQGQLFSKSIEPLLLRTMHWPLHLGPCILPPYPGPPYKEMYYAGHINKVRG